MLLLNNQPSLTSDLLASLEKPEFCDIKIEASDGELQANKAFLSIRSEYFSRMFNNNFVESSTGLCKLPYPKAVVEKQLDYLYTGEMVFDDLQLPQLLDLLDLLRKMCLSEEFLRVESFLRDKITKKQFSSSDCVNNLDTYRCTGGWCFVSNYDLQAPARRRQIRADSGRKR